MGSLYFFLCVEAHRTLDGLMLTQSKYIPDLLVVKMDGAKLAHTHIAASCKLSFYSGTPLANTSLFHSTVGVLQYLTNTSWHLLCSEQSVTIYALFY